MTGQHYDVVVVGGGINGVGVAQAAAAAGHSVLLLEQTGLAAGTSSKSSKLVHGGLRYLESFEFKLVHESLVERALLLKLAPDLVQLQHFRVPIYMGARRSPLLLRAGLSLYYLLSQFERNARFTTLPRHTWNDLDGLSTRDLRAVFRYTDARTNDALLTGAVMRSAESLGAELACPAELVAAELRPDGVAVEYTTHAGAVTCTASVMVNAAGPWVNTVAARINGMSQLGVELVQGAHIEVGGEMSGDFYYVESPRDGRAVFVMPRDGRIIIGTTETRFRDQPELARPLPAEELYLLNVAGHYFPQFRGLGRQDLLDSWAGLRVLPTGDGHAFHRSREVVLHRDRPTKPRVLSIYGGKLTTYRVTAQQVLARIAPALPERRPVASTRELRLQP